MKVKDIIYAMQENNYLMIRSNKTKKDVCLSSVRNEKLRKYYDHDLLAITLEMQPALTEDDKETEFPCFVLLINDADKLNVNEACDKILTKIIGESGNTIEQLKVTNKRVEVLLRIKENKYNSVQLIDQRDIYTSKIRYGEFTDDDFDTWYVLTELLIELDILKKH